MAEIPLAVLQRRAPRPGVGQPAGTVGLPRQAAPAAGLAEAIGYAGRQVGQSLMGMAEVQLAVRQRAEAVQVQDFQAQFTDDLLEGQQRLAVDRSIPPMELRARGEALRDQLLEKYSADLPARVRPKFLATARQAAIQPLYALDQVGVQRFGEQAKTTLEHRSAQLTRQTVQSTTPAERVALQAQHDALFDDYAAQGLLAPADVPMLKQKHRDAVVVADLEGRIRQDPAGMLTQFLKGPADNLDVPPTELTRLTDTAYSALSRQVSMEEAAEQKAKRILDEKQGQQASTYRMQIYKTGVTTEELTALIGPINQDRAAGRLSEADHDDLLGKIHTLTGKLTDDTYKDRDIPTVAQAGWLLIELAETTAHHQQARDWVVNHAKELSTTTVQQMLARIDVRRDKQAYTNRDAYKEGRQLMLSGAFPGGIVPAALDSIDDKVKRSTALALQTYAEQMQQIYETEGPEKGDQKARELAVKLRDLYFPKPEAGGVAGQPKPVPGVPEALQTFQTVEEAAKYLEQSDLPESLKDQYYTQFKKYLPARQIQKEYEQTFRSPAYQQEFQQRYPGAQPPQGEGRRLPGFTPVPPAPMEETP